MAIKKLLKYSILGDIYRKSKLNKYRRTWIKRNPNSDIIPNSVIPFELVEVGKASYGELNIITFGRDTKLLIGNYVSIANEVTFLLDVEHYIDHISTYPFKVKILKSQEYEAFSKGNIVIEDDAWIGYRSTIMSGVKIGKGAVVAAGSVVTKDVPPYSIVGGVPAKVIKYRFTEEIINELNNLNYKKLCEEQINSNISKLYTPIVDIKAEELTKIVHVLSI